MIRDEIKGKAWKFGSNVSTDSIAPGRLISLRANPKEYAKHVLEDARPEFAREVKEDDFIVADRNFGCGSSREIAPLIIKEAGVGAVLSKSFGRIFYRNAINIGLAILECDEAAKDIRNGDQVKVDFGTGVIENLTTGKTYQAEPFPPFIQNIIEKGGLLNSIKDRL